MTRLYFRVGCGDLGVVGSGWDEAFLAGAMEGEIALQWWDNKLFCY